MTDFREEPIPEDASAASRFGRFSPAIPADPAQRKPRREMPVQLAMERPEVNRSMGGDPVVWLFIKPKS